jgi:hypothetical protein
MNRKPNYRAALDAAIGFCFHFARHRRGASEHGCYMSAAFSVIFGCALAVSIWSSAISCAGQTQGTPPSERTQTNAPTGTYATGAPLRLTLHLGANGTYEVQAELHRQQGTWEWDGKQREFRLKPTPGNFPFDLRRLRVDRVDPACLQWIPVSAGSGIGLAGAIDYVRFIRRKD